MSNMSPGGGERRLWLLVLPLFFLSGASGLVYEVAWTRLMGHIFGTTALATATVLASYMGGLALGSFLFGRTAGRWRNPLVVYGLLELGVGVFVIVFPGLLSLLDRLYTAVYRSAEPGFFAMSLFRFGTSFLVLLVPTTLMGGTLPILSELLVRKGEVGAGVGRLYAVNTAGAVIGTFSTGFFLLPALGVRTTTLIGAGANLGVGLLCLAAAGLVVAARGEGRGPREPGETRGRALANVLEPSPVGPTTLLGLVLLAAGAAGFAALMLEVAWTKVLTLVLGPSTYAFTTMLTTFLCGIALGSYLASRFLGRAGGRPFVLGGAQIGVALLALLATPLFRELPELFLEAFPGWEGSWAKQTATKFGLCFLLMLPATILMGAVFPLLCDLGTRWAESVGRRVGQIYAANTTGAILGSFLAGFVLIPTIGTQNTVTAAASASMAMGLVFLLGLARRPIPGFRYAVGTTAVVAGLFVGWNLPEWDRALMTSGIPIYASRYLRAPDLQALVRQPEMLYYAETPTGIVSVSRVGKALTLVVDGKIDASNVGDMPTQILIGALPMLFHPKPESVLVIGLGSGITLGSVEQHPARRIVCVEISPAVVEASGYFSEDNHDCLDDPRLDMIVSDGRNYLKLTEDRYDCIISQPSNPWIAGQSNLFSREFFLLCRERLAEQGLVCQWVQSYAMSQQDLQTVIRTFLSVFPNVSVWLPVESDVILLGSLEPLIVDYGQVEARVSNPKVLEELTRIGIQDVPDLLAYFVAAGAGSLGFVPAVGPIHNDDNRLLEFSAPRSLYEHTLLSNLMLVARAAGDPRDHILDPELGRSEALDAALVPRIQARRLAIGALNTEVEKGVPFALELARRAWRLNSRDPFARRVLSRLLWTEGDHFLETRELDRAEAAYRECLEVEGRAAIARQGLALLLLEREDAAGAVAEARAALALEPNLSRSHYALGAGLGKLGDTEGAIRSLRRSLALEPGRIEAMNILGIVYASAGRLEEAAAEWERVLAADPNNVLAREGLSRVRSRTRAVQ